MFQLDDNLLQELGLGSLPPAEKNKMLAHIYETLELRVGMRLADQMSDQQLDEFEGFIDGNLEHAKNFLNTNVQGWEQSPDFIKQRDQATSQGGSADAVVPEFAALKWLEKNFPDYKTVVGEGLDKLKSEIRTQAPAIVQATMSAVQAPPAGATPAQPPQNPSMPPPQDPYQPPASPPVSPDPTQSPQPMPSQPQPAGPPPPAPDPSQGL
jgi:hypothetical protein